MSFEKKNLQQKKLTRLLGFVVERFVHAHFELEVSDISNEIEVIKVIWWQSIDRIVFESLDLADVRFVDRNIPIDVFQRLADLALVHI